MYINVRISILLEKSKKYIPKGTVEIYALTREYSALETRVWETFHYFANFITASGHVLQNAGKHEMYVRERDRRNCECKTWPLPSTCLTLTPHVTALLESARDASCPRDQTPLAFMQRNSKVIPCVQAEALQLLIVYSLGVFIGRRFIVFVPRIFYLPARIRVLFADARGELYEKYWCLIKKIIMFMV